MCGCIANGKTPPTYEVVLPGGRVKTYSRQDNAENEALRTGGYVKPPAVSS